MTTAATESTPAVVRVPKEATTVTITAISASSADSQLTFVGELPDGWSIAEQIPTDINAKDGHLTHQFTIEMTENTAEELRNCTFKLNNIFEPSANVTFTLSQDRPVVNPLKYVAEYNLLSPGVFATEQSIERDKNGYFTREQVKSGTLAPAGYHMAGVDEFVSIITKSNVFADASNHAEANVIIHGKTISDATYDSKKVGYKLAYVLRFKDSDGQSSENTCAFRYEFEQITGLTITCRALGSSFSGDINTISNESYWTDHAENNIIRFFPSCGRLNNGLLEDDGKRASSWTCSISRSFSYYFFGAFGFSYISSLGLPDVALPVRVFRD